MYVAEEKNMGNVRTQRDKRMQQDIPTLQEAS